MTGTALLFCRTKKIITVIFVRYNSTGYVRDRVILSPVLYEMDLMNDSEMCDFLLSIFGYV